MRNLIMFLFLPISIWAADKKNSNSLSPQTLSVQCPVNITITEGQRYDTAVAGFPSILSNNGGAVTITYIEILSTGNCANGTDLIVRNFTIRNAIGDIERCSQTIFIRHLKPDQLRIPTDTTIEYPKDGSLTSAIIGIGLKLGSLELTYIDTKVSNLCNIPVRIKRDWSVRDKCSNTVIKKSTNITLMAYQNSFEHNKSIVTDLCESEGEIVLTPKGDFGPYTYLWNNGVTSNSLIGVPAGNYSCVITDAFKCNQLLSVSLSNIAETADVGGLIATQNNYRVNPDSIYISDINNITKFCASPNGGLHYSFKVKTKKTGMMDYRFVKRSQVIDGISTKDIIVIQKHILGKQLFTDTLKWFAADVNRNNNVTSSDISEMRKLILGVKDTFTDALPWYFFRPDWKSVLTKNSTFENIMFKGININVYPKLNGDVLAVKMGDLDLSYKNTLVSTSSRLVNKKVKLNYLFDERKDGIFLQVYLNNSIHNLEGLQSEIILQDCQLGTVVESILSPDSYYFSDNKLSLSISTGDLLAYSANKPIIVLKLDRNFCISPSHLMLSTRINSEYYTSDSEVNPLEWAEIKVNDLTNATLVPNPFNDRLEIACHVDGYLQLDIVNSSGIKVFNSLFKNRTEMITKDWPAGIYFYRINGQNYQKTGALVKP